MRLQILRHAPPQNAARLTGRRDIDADCSDGAAFSRVARLIGAAPHVLCSPARRCLQTAAGLGLNDPDTDPALWEQDFGVWEGTPYADLPDLGEQSVAELATMRPEGGESFHDMADRVRPALESLARDTLVIAHAGTVRVALSMVIGPAALSFSVAPLSLTTMRRTPSGWAVEAVNVTCP
ncbi:histidine phosphatase family protein [Paracoccus sp. (in: a-proteobacteria)]|uniref:histidine phosphatase family protein n=1 Tax=Paracoccus sp. TaxID=267 RepID=UPI003A839037